MNTVSVQTPRTAGAIGLVEVGGDLDALLTPILGRKPAPVGKLRRENFGDFDDGLVYRFAEDGAFCFPHAGPMVVRMLVEALIAQGAESTQKAAAFPEAAGPMESLLLATLAQATSPAAVDLLLAHGVRQDDAPLPTPKDLDRSRRLDVLLSPPTVTIFGPPNAGKSTLFNALADQQLALVDDVAGTTRDHLEQRWLADGLVVQLVDTAGVRKSSGLEADAICHQSELIHTADLILSVANPEQAFLPPPPGIPTLKVGLQSDRGNHPESHLSLSVPQEQTFQQLAVAIRQRLVLDEDLQHQGPWWYPAARAARGI